MLREFETIVAISTPMGNGGIGIVRISGTEAIKILKKIFKTKKGISELKSHTINYGFIVDSNENIIDEVLVSVMLSPKTYTKEDVIEINCHGGIVSVSKVLEEVIKNGARVAEKGEFTKRAFLNGRIDLSQAESVVDIINAKTNLSQENAIKQLEGRLSGKVKILREEILSLTANIEASIDYPEHDLESDNISKTKEKTLLLLNEIEELLETTKQGKIIKEGIETVILGKPNVGKSSLLNTLLDEERAIVTDIPGTTRDFLQEYVNIKGIALKLIDTAGIRDTSDRIEKIGVEKSIDYIDKADLILFMLDGSEDLEKIDKELLEKIKNKKAIILVNKIDLPQAIDKDKIYKHFPKENILELSLKSKNGIEDLYSKIENMFMIGEISISSDVLVTNLRHKNCLHNCASSLKNVLESIENGLSEDFLTIDLLDSYNYLGEIIGEAMVDDLVDKIFSEFCLGK